MMRMALHGGLCEHFDDPRHHGTKLSVIKVADRCTAFDCRIQAGNGGKLSCSQAELTQTIKAAVDMFASISCQYPEIEGGTFLSRFYPDLYLTP